MHSSVIFGGKMWIIGGGIYDTSYPSNTVRDYGDVWASSDGENWERIIENPGWQARRFHSSAVYDDKIWIISGYHLGNRNDVWCSKNGRDWIEVENEPVWPPRHEPMCLVHDERLWMMGGFGERLFNDIWASEG
jgi:hypothetical protein